MKRPTEITSFLRSVELNAAGDKAFYCYDWQGERVRKVVKRSGGVVEERRYMGGYEVYRKTVAGATILQRTTHNISDGSTTFCRMERRDTTAPVLRYQYANHLGSASLELDAGGLLISYEEYRPFGTTSYCSGRTATEVSLKRYHYCGKERDEESGLYYYGARYYADWLGRFVSVDPLSDEFSSWTPYHYVHNNPINLIDPTGMLASTHTDANGKVLAVYDDGDLGVYRHDDAKTKSDVDVKRENSSSKSGGGEQMGHTLYINSFADDNGNAVGKIDFGSSAAADWIANFESVITGMANNPAIGSFKTRLFYAGNAGNGDVYDYKTKGGTTTDIWRGSQISDGIYASARDVGNYAAGAAARITGQSKFDFLTTAGAFNMHGNSKTDLVLNLSAYKASAAKLYPEYGEDRRSNHFQRLGYEGIKTLGSFNRNYLKIWKDK